MLYPKANFYLLPSRAWELLAGAILAIILPQLNVKKGWLCQLLALIGFGLIIYSIVSLSKIDLMPNKLTLIPVIGTMLIIAFANKETGIGKILGSKPLSGIGLISYSAYLWHQPLFAFARVRSLGEVSVDTYAALIICTLILAYLTWCFVETPFRKKNCFSRRQIFFSAISGASFFIIVGLVGVLTKGIPSRLSGDAAYYASFANKYRPVNGEICYSNRHNLLYPPQKQCIYNKDYNLNIALWGDSHAGALTDSLTQEMLMQKQGIIEIIYIGCPPVTGFKHYTKSGKCNQFNIEALKYIKNSDIQSVILLARWPLYIEGKRFNNGEGGVEKGSDGYGLPIGRDKSFVNNAAFIPEIGKIYRRTVTELLNIGKKVILVYPIPEAGWNVPDYFTKIHLHDYSFLKTITVSTSFNTFKLRTKNTYEQLDMLPNHSNLLKIYPENVFCNTILKGRCVLELNKKPLYYDDDHLNYIGGQLVSKEIIKEMKAKQWL